MPYLMHTGARVDLVVDTMVDLLDRDGIESLSLRRIADRIGLSPSTLSSHLSNKRRIIDLATVTGLWAAMCARPEPMPAERARAILRHACTAMGIAPTGDPET